MSTMTPQNRTRPNLSLERRAVPAREEIATMLHLLDPYKTDVEHNEDGNHREQRDADRRPRADPLKVDHRLAGVDRGTDRLNRVLFEDKDHIEDAQRVEGAEDQRHKQRGPQQGQCDTPELMERARSIHR